jgi:hypothetical protein
MTPRASRYDPDASVRLRDKGLLWREVGGEIVALSLHSSQYVSVNDSGSELWELLATGTTPRAMTRVLADRWHLDEQQATSDIETFLAQLSGAGLLET